MDTCSKQDQEIENLKKENASLQTALVTTKVTNIFLKGKIAAYENIFQQGNQNNGQSKTN